MHFLKLPATRNQPAFQKPFNAFLKKLHTAQVRTPGGFKQVCGSKPFPGKKHPVLRIALVGSHTSLNPRELIVS